MTMKTLRYAVNREADDRALYQLSFGRLTKDEAAKLLLTFGELQEAREKHAADVRRLLAAEA